MDLAFHEFCSIRFPGDSSYKRLLKMPYLVLVCYEINLLFSGVKEN
jgi:hypothetical protein